MAKRNHRMPYYGPKNAPGQLRRGNIDLNNRPQVENADGSISTVRSASTNADGFEVLFPTITTDGRNLWPENAFEYARKNRQHLGIFDTPENATAYAKALHNDQANLYGQKKNRFYTPTKRDYLAEALALAQAGLQGTAEAGLSGIGEVLSNPTKSLAALLTSGSGALAVNDALAKPAADQLVKDWGGVKPAMQAGSDVMALADILSGKEQSTPFASAQGTQLAGDAANNAAVAALDVSTLLPAVPAAKAGVKAGIKATGEFIEGPGRAFGRAMGAGSPQLNTFIGPGAFGWNKQAAKRAVQMEKAGAAPEEIWRETGTGRNYYGKLRQEIDDSGMTIEGELPPDVAMPLPVAIDHPELLAAEPRLAKTKIKNGDTLGGVYYPWMDQIEAWDYRPEDLRKTVLHEIQHAEQQRSGNNWWAKPTKEHKTWAPKEGANGDINYYDPFEREARITEGRIDMSADQRRDRFPFGTFDEIPVPALYKGSTKDPTTLGMGFPFSGKDGEKPLLSALRDVFKGKPKESPLDQFTPPTTLDDIFTGGVPRGPRELTGGSQNPAGMDGSAFNLNTPNVPYDPARGFQGLDTRLGKGGLPGDIQTIRMPQGTVSIGVRNGEFHIDGIAAHEIGAGHGKELVAAALERARSLGAERVWVKPDNTSLAQAFWRKYGIGGEGGYLDARFAADKNAKTLSEALAKRAKPPGYDDWSPEWRAAYDKGLPMDTASRMARAREQGFNTPAFRGMREPYQEEVAADNIQMFSADPRIASIYAGNEKGSANMLSALLNTDNFSTVNASGRQWDGIPLSALPDDLSSSVAFRHMQGRANPTTDTDMINFAADDAGRNGVIFRGLREADGNTAPTDTFSVFDPANIRSVNAAFDPANIGKPNLLGMGAPFEGKAKPPGYNDWAPEWRAAYDKGLPMDEASRMQRAQEQGFEGPFYHGMPRPMSGDAFRTSSPRERSFFATSDPQTADHYAADGGNLINGGPDFAYNEGAAVYPVMIRNGEKFGGPEAEILVRGSSNVRSPFAAFDPENIGKANLLGMGRAAVDSDLIKLLMAYGAFGGMSAGALATHEANKKAPEQLRRGF